MFDKIIINNFYKKLKNNKRIDSNYLNTIDKNIKEKIIKDSRFCNFIDLKLILNGVDNVEIDKSIFELLSDQDLKVLIDRLYNERRLDSVDLTSVFNILKDKLLNSDTELKEKISILLFNTVKESYIPKIDYINYFISLFNYNERIELLDNKNILNFLTFYSKSIDIYYGYDNFFENYIDSQFSEEEKYKLLLKIYNMLPNNNTLNKLFIKKIIKELNIDNIIKLMDLDKFKECFKYKSDDTFNYQELLTIINKINDDILKKNMIKEYFTGYKYINNLIRNRNEDSDKSLYVNGKTILAFYELGFITENIDEYMIKNCKDKEIFNYITKFHDKEEVLLKISNEVEENSLLEFANKYKINIYKEKFVEKFADKIFKELKAIKDIKLRNIFKRYLIENYNKVSQDKINLIKDILLKISNSNSNEILNIKEVLAKEIINQDNMVDILNKIEDIFLKNNLPTIGKIYSVFEILHPDLKDFNFKNDLISPTLKNKSIKSIKTIIFNDLLKCSLGSNNKSIIEYINTLEQGETIYKNVINNKIDINNISDNELEILNNYVKHLITLYNNTEKGKRESINYKDDIKENIIRLNNEFNGIDNLSDEIIKKFCHFAGFDTLKDLKEYMINIIEKNNIKNYRNANIPFKLEEGDFIKGIGNIDYIKNILENGSVAKEFLGGSVASDRTPLDTDLSKILKTRDNIKNTISLTSSINYGPIWFVLKNDDRFLLTRNDMKEELDTDYKSNKLELFYSGVSGDEHYGIRTGFASSEIDYIITQNNDDRIGLEIALNGFYIPVVNLEGELIFSPKDYENIRSKMSGLSYYGLNNYNFSNNLYFSGLENVLENKDNIEATRNKIYESIEKSISELNLKLKKDSNGDISDGTVYLIDTGSTGRNTNLSSASDFDFMMKIDRNIIFDENKLKELKRTISKSFISIKDNTITSNGDFRFKGVMIEGIDSPIDIDITFVQKTNKVNYSTDNAIKDRLNTIKKQDPKKYELVIANILFAKKLLKENGCYKPNRGEKPEGGLGGVGIENWILMNGGSFIDAANDFLYHTNNKTFEEFKNTYKIWDFGDNYLSIKNNKYPHDNFVMNMNESGFNKMRETLNIFINSINLNNDENYKKL